MIAGPAHVEIINKRGLHARAAAKFVKTTGAYAAEVRVCVAQPAEGGTGCCQKDTAVSGRSIMGLMMLAAGPGTTLELTAEGAESGPALAALIDLIERRFDEDE